MTARAETLVANQLFMAQAVNALADHIASSTGYALAPVTFSNLPAAPSAGMIAAVTDHSGPLTWGSTVLGGGSSVVLTWYNGVAWTVVGK